MISIVSEIDADARISVVEYGLIDSKPSMVGVSKGTLKPLHGCVKEKVYCEYGRV